MIRPIARRDAATWHRLHQDNFDWLRPWEATVPHGSPHTPGSYARLVKVLRKQGREGRSLPFVMTKSSRSDEMIGQVTVAGVTWGSARWAQIGYWIAREHAGQGLTPLAVAMVVDHCFGTVGLHRVEIAIRPENTSSLRIVEKLGFTRIGLAPRYLHIDGGWRDHLLFALTVEDLSTTVVARLESQATH